MRKNLLLWEVLGVFIQLLYISTEWDVPDEPKMAQSFHSWVQCIFWINIESKEGVAWAYNKSKTAKNSGFGAFTLLYETWLHQRDARIPNYETYEKQTPF